MKQLPESFLHELEQLAAAYLTETDPIRQSGFGGGPARWRTEREPILEAVNASGTFLDLGCANGYLLESLGRWAADRRLSLDPYGVDHSRGLIELARRRFPGIESHFVVANAWSWKPQTASFRFAYTMWDVVPRDYLADYLQRLLVDVVAPGGRLIVGAYGSRSRCERPFDIARFLRENTFHVAGETTGGTPPLTAFAWIDNAAAFQGMRE
jgi:SAM-dependent methyltransferase